MLAVGAGQHWFETHTHVASVRTHVRFDASCYFVKDWHGVGILRRRQRVRGHRCCRGCNRPALAWQLGVDRAAGGEGCAVQRLRLTLKTTNHTLPVGAGRHHDCSLLYFARDQVPSIAVAAQLLKHLAGLQLSRKRAKLHNTLTQ